jgi:hypothetical protein
MIKNGSKWEGSDHKRFVVLHTIELDGHMWVHYREDNHKIPTLESKEYSCYEESFLSRFREMPE